MKVEVEDKRYTVIRDTREQSGKGWTFSATKDCAGTVIQKMDTGDYTLVGYEDIFTVDRKGCISEFAKNLSEKRFENELERMKTFKYAAIILEFNLEDITRWPKNSGIPKAKQFYMKFTRHAYMARFWKVRLKYPHVDFIFAGDAGKEAISSLFKRMIEQYGPR